MIYLTISRNRECELHNSFSAYDEEEDYWYGEDHYANIIPISEKFAKQLAAMAGERLSFENCPIVLDVK